MPVRFCVESGVALLTLERPAKRNALDGAMWRELRDRCRDIGDVRVLIVTGAEGHFCAGMDLSPENPLIAEIAPALMGGQEAVGRGVIEHLKECVQALADVSVPTIAAIEGACVGGGFEIALACDMRIAAESASFSLPEVRMGMIPDVGGCARLTRLVGPGRAADMITTGRKVSGQQAFDLGMVERVVGSGAALAEAQQAARDIVGNAPEAVRLALNVVRMAPDLGLDESLSLETRAGAMALVSGEAREGIAAFLEKRRPDWS